MLANMTAAVASYDIESGTSIGTENSGISNVMLWACVVIVDAPVADDSMHRELGWHDLACVSYPNYSHKAGTTSEPGVHSVIAVT